MEPKYDQNGTLIGYTYSNGYVIWTYDTSWQSTGITLDATKISSGELSPVLTNNVTTGYTYTDTFGTLYTYNVDTNGAVTGYTSNYSGPGYSYTYNFDALGDFNGYSHFDGTTTTTYDANWNVVSTVTVVSSNMVAILDAGGATIGYSVTDEWGTATNYAPDQVTVTGYSYTYVDTWSNTTSVTTYDANWNYIGSETKDASGNVLYSSAYSYTNGNFSGYTYFDGVTTWTYDANWNLLSTSANTTGMTPIYATPGDNTTTIVGYSTTDQWGTTTTYNTSGAMTGAHYSYTNWDGSISVTSYDANWNYLSSVTKDALGNVLYSSTYSYDVNGNFSGYSYFDGVTTYSYDASWNLLSTSVDTTGMTPIYAADGTTLTGYSSIDQWGTTTTYDTAGNKTGSSYSYHDSWNNTDSLTTYDANGNYLSSVTKDAAGNVLYSSTYTYVGNTFNGYSYFDGVTTWTYDANWNLTGSSVSAANLILNSTGDGYYFTDAWGTTTHYAMDSSTVTGYSYSYVDTWSNTTSITTYDASWNYLGSVTKDTAGNVLYSNSYSYLNGVFNGYTYFDGATTWTYDASWNLTGSSVNTASMTAIYATPGNNTTAIVGYSYTDQWGTTTTYDTAGNKTGSNYTYTNWDNSTTVTTYDANGNYLSSETTDATGKVLYSSSYSYDAGGLFAGYTYFDGQTTYTYDASWNLTGSTVNTASMTAVYATPGDNTTAIVGYTSTDAWGTTTNYDVNGVKTGSSYSYYDSWNNSTSVTTYDANGNYLSSVTKDAAGNVLYSSTYSYTNGNFSGYSYFDGVTTYNYDASWNLVSSTVNTASMTPIYATDGTTLTGYSTTDQWGTTTTYDTTGNKTGSSYSYIDTWNNTTSVTTYDANGNYLSSVTKDASGNVLYSSTYTYSGNTFTGYSYFDGVTTTVYDASWNLVSSTVNTASMTKIYAADGTTLTGYSTTDQWGTTTTYDTAGNKTGSSYSYIDTWNNSTSVTTYDANGNYLSSVTKDASGNVLYSSTYTYSGNTFTGYSYFDGVTTTVYDANWNFVSSTVSTASMTKIYAADGTTLTGYSNTDQWGTTTYYDLVGVKTGYSYSYTNWDNSVSVTTYDANNNYLRSETRDATGKLSYFNEYIYVGGVFDGYISFDGVTTWTYDANWNLVSSVVSTTGMTPVYATPGDNNTAIVGYSTTDQWGTTTTYDTAGNKTGSSYTYVDTWNNTTSVTTYDVNGNQVGYETKDATGKLLYSNTYTYVNGVFSGYTTFDGVTTWTYDANWNLLSAVVSTAGMTPLDASGNVLVDADHNGFDDTTAVAVAGYSHTDQWGTTNYYDTSGVKTGYSYSYQDTWNNTTSVSRYDANNNYLGYENLDAAGNLLNSETYSYLNGAFNGRVYFDGTTTWTYDASWTLISSVVSTASMTPLDASGNVLIDANHDGFDDTTAVAVAGYSYTDQWGTTTTYDTTGTKTGSSNTWVDTWSGNTTVSHYNANGNYLGSETKDSAGNVLYSNSYTYNTDGTIAGSSYFDGVSTWTYDANGTLLTDVGPYPTSMALNSDGITINFSEIAYAPTDPTALAFSMLKNGDPALPMNIVSFTGDGTTTFTIHTNQTLAVGDWVLLNYSGTTIDNGVRDALGNVMVNNSQPGYGGSAEGSTGDNVINLSNTTIFSATGRYDISGGLGNDTITGSAAFDWIMGGAGADTLTGGTLYGDHFEFVQDNSSLISYANGSYTFTSIDRITDFSAGDFMSLNVADSFAPGSQTQGLSMMAAAPTDGLAADQSFFLVQGNYSAGQFTVNAASGADTMVVYDSDATTGVSQSGVMLSGVTVGQLGTMADSSYISYMGGSVTPPTGDVPASTLTTSVLQIGGSVNGTIDSADVSGDAIDRDWYAVNLTAGTSYQFDLTPTSTLDGSLILYDGSGIYLTYQDANLQPGVAESLTFTPTSSGTYYVAASNYYGATFDVLYKTTGGYTLSASLAGTGGTGTPSGSILVSSDANGLIGNATSTDYGLSADGRFVLFESDASNLVTGDTNAMLDLFVKDTQTGATVRVSTDASGAQSSGFFFASDISADGRYVAMASDANNLVTGDTDGLTNVFIKDVQTNAITQVDTDAFGNSALVGVLGSDVTDTSADGRYVVIGSDAANLVANDNNNTFDLFLKDTQTNAITRVNTAADGAEVAHTVGADNYLGGFVSDDGRYVVFESDANNLVAGDTNGVMDIFKKDIQTGAITQVNTDANGAAATGGAGYIDDFTTWNLANEIADISADGRYVLFVSAATNLVTGDTNGVKDVFIKDTLTGAIERVSTDANGFEANGASQSPFHSLSADGRYAVFHSGASNLVAGDTNNLQDIFVKDIWTGAIARLNLDASGGQAVGGGSNKERISDDGSTIAFRTGATNLVANDTNGVQDVVAVANPFMTDTLAPDAVDAWADPTINKFGVVFSESIKLNNQSLAGVTAYKNASTQMTLTGAMIDPAFPAELAMTYSDSLVAGDFIVLAYDAAVAGNNITDLAGNATLSGVLVTSVGLGGGTVGATVDASTFNLPAGITSVLMRGNAGVDVFTGTNGNDTIITGRGADTITGGGAQDYIDLSESTKAGDTVVINVGDSTPAGGASDLVHYFDVMSGVTNDVLDLPSDTIAVNTTGVLGITNLNTGSILSHSITNGMISFDDASTFTSALVVGDMTNWSQVKSYMMANIADGQTVATYIDMDGNGSYMDVADRLAVFQGNATMDVQVQLYDTMGVVTGLSNTALMNSVTII